METDEPIHPMIKVYLGFPPDAPDGVVRDVWETFASHITKPCGQLEWCPYGPLVEDFPLRGEGGHRREPLAKPSACTVFGHDCPAYYVSEPFADPEAVYGETLCEDCRESLRQIISAEDQTE